MIDYEAALTTIIKRGEYLLEVMEDRINACWLEGNIDSRQRDYLLTLAAEYARDEYQIDVVGMLADHERRIWELEHPTEQYAEWVPGYVTKQHEIVRYDVTSDGNLDLCRYDGGRASTSLSIGKIEGWHLLDRELVATHTITRDANGGYVLTPIESGE
jgi:hypothetical protein